MALYGINFVIEGRETFRSLEAPHDHRAIEDAGLRLKGVMRDRPGVAASACVGRGARAEEVEWLGAWDIDAETGAQVWNPD